MDGRYHRHAHLVVHAGGGGWYNINFLPVAGTETTPKFFPFTAFRVSMTRLR
jgi:hypothetical protein